MKKSLLFLSSLLLFFCLLIFPARTFFYACEGVNLWFHTILPSLLPFLILTSLLLETGAMRRIPVRAEIFFQTVLGLSPAGFYALFLGLLCGFPMGARITAQLYEAKKIDRNEACYLLTFCSSPSPAFLSSYVILTAFSGQIHPGFVFGVLYVSNFLTGFLFRLIFHRFRPNLHDTHQARSAEKKEMSKQTSKGNLLDTSIMNGFEIITQLGGYIILFSILSGLLMDLHPFGSASPLLCGVLEITTGISQLAASSLPSSGKVSAVLACAAFGGLSVTAQTNCMIHNSGLPLWPYLAGKLCCAVFAGTLGLLLFAFLF
ncbi:nucleoside recognition domain-containing protein [Fusicatenibacter sp.]